MNRSTWAFGLVLGFALALGYGVMKGFIEAPVAAVLVLILLAAVMIGGEGAVEDPEPVPEVEPPTNPLPFGFHPSEES